MLDCEIQKIRVEFISALLRSDSHYLSTRDHHLECVRKGVEAADFYIKHYVDNGTDNEGNPL